MPLEQLLAMYGYESSAGKARERDVSSSGAEQVTSSSQPSSSTGPHSDRQSDEDQTPEQESEVSAGSSHDMWRLPSSSGRIFYADSDGDDDDEDDEDFDESEEAALHEALWKRQIQVGPEHQADVPDCLSESESDPVPVQDHIEWDPDRLPDQEVERYLNIVKSTACSEPANQQDGDVKVAPVHVALSLLHQCDYRPDEALQKQESVVKNGSESAIVLTDSEVKLFEDGLLTHGKDFHAIHKDQVSTLHPNDITVV